MARSNGVFSRGERRAALLALLAAALIAVLSAAVQQFTRPSLGPGGVDAYASAPPPGVLDAQPIA